VLPILLQLGACAPLDPVASQNMAIGAATSATMTSADTLRPPSADVIVRAINDPRRLPADRERDEQRQADDVLAFFGIQPGMTVLDLYSGGGYYTELLSHVVGNAGRVVAHNNTPYQSFAKDEIEKRYADGRLPNVERIVVENNELELPADTFDAVLMTLAYHDVYYVNEEMGWMEIDGPRMLAEIYASMRPGAVLGVVDHVADKGAPASTGGTLHRLDPDLIIRDITAVGFLFDGESDVLRNFEDDHTRPVFDDSIRGRTDRVVLRFRKPVTNAEQ
jgi:predicted methyltransferase